VVKRLRLANSLGRSFISAVADDDAGIKNAGAFTSSVIAYSLVSIDK
jgi:hypothetical protein